MNCAVCGEQFAPKNSAQKYCTVKCRNYKRARDPSRKERMKVWRRKSNLKISYGITPEDYERMLAAQGGACFLCGGKQRPGRCLAVDHCHNTGRVRGLLCDMCNRKIIGSRDVEFFRRCVMYMEEPRVDES